MSVTVDFVVIGAGIAGLTIARALRRRGATVSIVERRKAGHGATWAAAGMLAPLIEARIEDRPIAEFGHCALDYYPAFLESVHDEVGVDMGYSDLGTLYVAVDRDHLSLLRHAFAEQQALGLPVEWRSGHAVRELEPYLAPGIPGGIYSTHDRQVNNRALVEALIETLRRSDVIIHELAVEPRIEQRAEGIRVEWGATTLLAGHAVFAPGADGSVLRQLDADLAAALRPVKGQVLRLDQSRFPVIQHVVRTPDVYLVPKSDGTIVVGASIEDKGFDESVTVGEVYELLRSARECVPALLELPLIEMRAGFRPATRDHLPMLGTTDTRSFSLAAGYYRHGILFAPLAAEILADNLVSTRSSHWLDVFSPLRFHERVA